MFNEITENHCEYSKKLVTTYEESKELGLNPEYFKFRPLSQKDFENIFSVIDQLQPMLNYDHISGGCLYVHNQLKNELIKHGYLSELIFGDVLINDRAYIDCSIDDLKQQLRSGIEIGKQKVHCWLMLENYQFFDATLYRDLTDGVYAAELYGYGATTLDGNLFNHEPMLAGYEFIKRTNPISENI